MAMARVCDICGKPVAGLFKQMKVIEGSDAMEPRNYKTVKSLDFHLKCYSGFDEWLKRTREQAGGFVEEIAPGPQDKSA